VATQHLPAPSSLACQILIYPIVDCDTETASYRENADGYLLTLTAGQLAGRLQALLVQDREQLVDQGHGVIEIVLADVSTHLEVLLHRHGGVGLLALSHLDQAAPHDAIRALVTLAEADAAKLTRRAYNIKGFSASAGEILEQVRRHFPEAEVRFEPVPVKQRIVDSWPGDVDDSRARRDWGLSHDHGLAEAFDDYLVPALRKRYADRSTDGPLRFPQRS